MKVLNILLFCVVIELGMMTVFMSQPTVIPIPVPVPIPMGSMPPLDLDPLPDESEPRPLPNQGESVLSLPDPSLPGKAI